MVLEVEAVQQHMKVVYGPARNLRIAVRFFVRSCLHVFGLVGADAVDEDGPLLLVEDAHRIGEGLPIRQPFILDVTVHATAVPEEVGRDAWKVKLPKHPSEVLLENLRSDVSHFRA